MKRLTDFIDATNLGFDFLIEHSVETPINCAQINVLRELDEKCVECSKGTEMLCDGARLCFNIANKDRPEFELEQCWKLVELSEQTHWRTRMRQANLGDAKVRDILSKPSYRSNGDVEHKDEVFYVDGNEMDNLSYGEYSREFTDKIKEYMVAFVNCGFSPKYVFTVQLYKHERLSSTNVYLNDERLMEAMSKEIYDPEWLVLDGLDTKGNPKIRSALLKCLRWRLDEMRPTTVSLSKTVEATTEEEDDIYGEIAKWNKFNLR